MTEKVSDEPKIATLEEFLNAGKVIKTIVIDKMKIRIRPLTFLQEFKIAQVISEHMKKGMTHEVADREYMKLAVLNGVIEPKMDEFAIHNAHWGYIKAISDAIGALTKNVEKKA